jgi:hypothetical protein
VIKDGQLVPQETDGEWDCEYAHTLLELMYHPQVYHTTSCDHFDVSSLKMPIRDHSLMAINNEFDADSLVAVGHCCCSVLVGGQSVHLALCMEATVRLDTCIQIFVCVCGLVLKSQSLAGLPSCCHFVTLPQLCTFAWSR